MDHTLLGVAFLFFFLACSNATAAVISCDDIASDPLFLNNLLTGDSLAMKCVVFCWNSFARCLLFSFRADYSR